ncbi:hypothetical protein ACQ4M4_28305 [Leptolyngbya sp. AN02str]|uniref:hypothetical protein n=1 Tax=Leptolyngbya sp. AN02str TaxID=3423363 RepID=UPI003D30FAFF
MSSKTLEANSIPIPPQLAGLLKQRLGRSGTGFDEGAFLQQLHYWTHNSQTAGWIVDGVKWVYNSLKSWQAQFPWMSEYGLRRAIANLKKLGLIQTAQHWITSYRRVMFYCIDYEQLEIFFRDVCDQFTHRGVNSDHVDTCSCHTSYSEISSVTSDSEQQTVVVSHDLENIFSVSERDSTLDVEVKEAEEDVISPASSGSNSSTEDAMFPELVDAVTEAVREPLPLMLKRAIAQHPERVEGAIQYLKQQQQRRKIENPIGYLYTAIAQGWQVSVAAEKSAVPQGFRQWFDWAKAQGVAIAAMMIDGEHHTLHVEHGWMLTKQVMQDYPALVKR